MIKWFHKHTLELQRVLAQEKGGNTARALQCSVVYRISRWFEVLAAITISIHTLSDTNESHGPELIAPVFQYDRKNERKDHSGASFLLR